VNDAVLGLCVARILITKDRGSMRKELRALLLTRPHWQVCDEAEDGSEAVKKAAQLAPDLIVMDFRMYDVDGLRAANEIFRRMPSVPIVMYTMYKNEELETTAKLVGIRRVIGKEEGALTLMRAIEAELQAARA